MIQLNTTSHVNTGLISTQELADRLEAAQGSPNQPFQVSIPGAQVTVLHNPTGGFSVLVQGSGDQHILVQGTPA